MPLGIFILLPLGREFCAGQCQMLPVTGHGLPVRNYKAMHSLLLTQLGLSARGRGQAVYLSRSASTSNEHGDRSAKGLRHPDIYLSLSAACWDQLLKETLETCKLHEVGS